MVELKLQRDKTPPVGQVGIWRKARERLQYLFWETDLTVFELMNAAGFLMMAAGLASLWMFPPAQYPSFIERIEQAAPLWAWSALCAVVGAVATGVLLWDKKEWRIFCNTLSLLVWVFLAGTLAQAGGRLVVLLMLLFVCGSFVRYVRLLVER
jgi:hypothetical protein